MIQDINSAQSELRNLFREKGVTQVTVIDDCFDPIVELLRAEPGTAALTEFLAALHDSEEDLAYLKGICEAIHGDAVVLTTTADIPPEVITYLHENPRKLDRLDRKWNQTIGRFWSENGPAHIDRLLKYLEEDLALIVRKMNSDGKEIDPDRNGSAADSQIIFLDYQLKGDFEQAEALAIKLFDDYDVGAKPLFVLMSHILDAEDYAEGFCERTEILPGMFNFVPKGQLTDTFELGMRMRLLAMSWGAGQRLQQFIHKLKAESEGVVSEFVAEINRLTVSDYSYLQSLSLSPDGQPLGEYLAWLFGNSLNSRLFGSALLKERQELDRVVFPQAVSGTARLSEVFTRLYTSVFFDTNVREFGPHPAGIGGDPATDWLILQGDVFRAKERAPDEVMLVINPACDIAYSPGHRKFHEELSLLLVPGSLELIPGEVESLKGTELIRLEGKHYRIGWDIERVISVRFGEIGNWVSEHGYKLVAQMRLPYVLQVQQRFVANLTRVGTPVPAPIYQRADAQILVRDEGEISSNLYAVLLQTHKKRQLVLPWVTLLAAREGLRKVCEAAARRSPSPKGLPKWKEACQHPELWWRHEVPQNLPKPNRLKKLGDLPVAFSFNSIFDVQKELKQHPVIIKIVADEPESDDEVPS